MNMQIYGTYLPQVCELDLEGPSFSGGVAAVEPGSFSGKKQEACKKWSNGKCFKPCKYAHMCSVCNGSKAQEKVTWTPNRSVGFSNLGL